LTFSSGDGAAGQDCLFRIKFYPGDDRLEFWLDLHFLRHWYLPPLMIGLNFFFDRYKIKPLLEGNGRNLTRRQDEVALLRLLTHLAGFVHCREPLI
jgi:hypothetical protein